MKALPVKQIKSALESASHEELLNICMRLVKFKKENKELATYMLFESGNETGYIIAVKDSLDLMFAEINTSNLYYVKKSLRKIIRTANKFIRYSEEATTEVEILLYIADAIFHMPVKMDKSLMLVNLYNSLLKKIDKALSSMHEDLQYDYRKQLNQLQKSG